MNHTRELLLLPFALAALLAGNVLAQEQKPPATLAELRQRLAAHVGQPKYDAALWDVKIVFLDTGITLFEQNPQKLFRPASNSKLYTVVLALDRWAPITGSSPPSMPKPGPTRRARLRET
jgi:D-alanyl-D-alanine carboxypeptidase